MLNHDKYMKICFSLAKKSEGKTSPNPIVGAILVDKNGNIVAKGWHKGYGLDHAEVDCIKNYESKYGKTADYSDLTLYVNLEPCNHYGKTPPCSDFIIEKGIKKVVVAIDDPNPKHSGGIKKLENVGVKVIKNILKDEALKLNEVFFKNVKESMPFISMKTATTLDGKIATKTGSSKWITSEKSRKYVQKLRNKYDAILTSSNTVIADNPSLIVHLPKGKKIARIIFDSNLKTNPKSKVYKNDGAKVLLFHTGKNLKNKPENYPNNVKLIEVYQNSEGKIDIKKAVKVIYNEGIRSIMLEAGGILSAEFIKQNLIDKIYHFFAPKILGDNDAKSYVQGFDIKDIKECRKLKFTTFKKIDSDFMVEIYF